MRYSEIIQNTKLNEDDCAATSSGDIAAVVYPFMAQPVKTNKKKKGQPKPVVLRRPK